MSKRPYPIELIAPATGTSKPKKQKLDCLVLLEPLSSRGSTSRRSNWSDTDISQCESSPDTDSDSSEATDLSDNMSDSLELAGDPEFDVEKVPYSRRKQKTLRKVRKCACMGEP